MKVKLKKAVKELSEREGETEVHTDSVPLRAAVILCEGTPGSYAI